MAVQKTELKQIKYSNPHLDRHIKHAIQCKKDIKITEGNTSLIIRKGMVMKETPTQVFVLIEKFWFETTGDLI